MAGQSYQLVVRAGPTPGKVYPIMKQDILIGRDPNCDILINDAEVSRHHASIKSQPDGYVIEDLGSTNGTVINGQRIMGPHVLHPGEIVNLGEHISLVFDKQPSFDPDATTVSPVNIPPPPPKKIPEPVYIDPVADPFAISEEEPDFPEKKPRSKRLLVIILAIILLVICVCIIAGIYIDNNYLWCNVLPFWPPCQVP